MRNLTASGSSPQPQGPPNYPGMGSMQLNPPFDPRMLSTGGANPALKARPIKRGRIVRDTSQLNSPGYQVNFMFNPTVVQADFPILTTVDKSQIPAGQAIAATPGQGTLSGLELLVDRTYDVTKRDFSLTAKFGVHADVLAFYTFLDMISSPPTTSSSWETLYPQSLPTAVYSYLYIGDTLKYYGWISSLSVQYVHFSYDMIPTRAAIGIDFNILTSAPTTAVTPGGSNSSSSSSSNGSTTTPSRPRSPLVKPGPGVG